MKEKIRIGVLGAAKITPMALITPSKALNNVEVVAVAARDRRRAEKFARKHGIPTVLDDYDSLIMHPEIDAVYNPLPNSLHAHWSIRAMRAGKHVLCEKPLAANTDEAIQMHQVAQEEERILMEAFHWRYHPLAKRLVELVANQSIGQITNIEASFCVPLPFASDIRYNPQLAGGALMDTGCYTIHILRHVMQQEPEVISATAIKHSEGIDRTMKAELSFPDGAMGSIHCSIWGWPLLSVSAKLVGTEGTISVLNPILPQLVYHHISIQNSRGKTTERFGDANTYVEQLRAFCSAIQKGENLLTSSKDGIKNMRVIDAIYRKAGMNPRLGWK